MENKRNFANRFDWTLAFILFTFLVISLLAIASAQTSGQYGINYVPKQMQWYVIGAVIIGIVMFLSQINIKMSWYMYGAGIALLVLLILCQKEKVKSVHPLMVLKLVSYADWKYSAF